MLMMVKSDNEQKNEHILACKELLEECFSKINMSIKITKQGEFKVIEIYNSDKFLVTTCHSVSEAIGFKKGWEVYKRLFNNDELNNLINEALA